MSEEQTTENVRRREYAGVWLFFLGAIAFHGVIVFALSPSLYMTGEDTSPKGLLKKARRLRKEEKYKKAFKTYELLMTKRPEIPVVFKDGAKEMQKVRLKMLEQQRKERQKARKAKKEKEEEAGKEGEKKKGTADEQGEEEPAEGKKEESEPSGEDMPALPGLE